MFMALSLDRLARPYELNPILPDSMPPGHPSLS
jgi:hypothetical protein